MRLLLTGAHGLLGQSIVAQTFNNTDWTLLATDKATTSFFDSNRISYQALDIKDRPAVIETIRTFQPDVVVNAAAYTHVDNCEVEREESWALNVTAVQNLVEALAGLPGTHLVHISTDYVFDGTKPDCYTEDSPVNPINYYGEEKLASERIVLARQATKSLLRTQGLYGTGHEIKKDYVRWIISMLEKGEPFGAIVDQKQNWTHADDLALMCLRAAALKADGLYHACGSEPATRFEFAIAIADEFGHDKSIIGEMYTRELTQLAKRPVNSAFCIDKMKDEFRFTPNGIAGGLKKYRGLLGRETTYVQPDLN